MRTPPELNRIDRGHHRDAPGDAAETRAPQGCREVTRRGSANTVSNRDRYPYSRSAAELQTGRPPFHCGFQPEGKPYREYVAHITSCRDRDCRERCRNRVDLLRQFQSRYGTIPLKGASK